MTRRAACVVASLLAVVGTLMSPVESVFAQTYPSKPITLVVPFPAGGIVDVAARVFAGDLGKRLNQQFVVEPRPGGSYLVGMRVVKNAAPDGYTLMLHTSGISMVQATLRNPGLDVRTDFAFITPILSGAQGVWIHSSVPATNWKEFVTWVSKNPGKINYGSTGVGGAVHLPTARMLNLAKLHAVHIPYAGGPPVMGALSSGDIHLLLWDVNTLMRQNKGQLRLLAMIGGERSRLAPDVPTLREVGVDMNATFWFGFFATGGTPQPVLEQLHTAIRDMQQNPEVQKYMAAQGWTPMLMSLDASKKLLAAEVDQWTQTVREASIPLSD